MLAPLPPLFALGLLFVACGDKDVDDTGNGPANTDGGTTAACPVPVLTPATTEYIFGRDGELPTEASIALFFSTGVDSTPPAECFTDSGALYLDSRIELTIPGEKMPVVSLPDSYAGTPNLAIEPIRTNAFTGEPNQYGDAFEGSETDPDLSVLLSHTPELEGLARLCNADGACDETTFTLELGLEGY